MFKRILITSGPTIEPIDPVRFISNRSSGKTGYYLAQGAKSLDIKDIIFITGPTAYLPSDVKVIKVENALNMRTEILKYSNDADVIIMAAAVTDFTSIKYYSEKMKKDQPTFKLEFQKNPDILYELGQKKPKGQILIGFAAETDDIFNNATKKLKRKNLDLLVLNEISDENPAFDRDNNQVYFVDKNGIRKLEMMKKSQVAKLLWEEIIKIREAG